MAGVEQRLPHLGLGEELRRHHLTGEVVGVDQRCSGGSGCRFLDLLRAIDDEREEAALDGGVALVMPARAPDVPRAVQRLRVHHVPEEGGLLGRLRHGVDLAHDVGVRPPVALLVLHQLVAERVRVLGGVPLLECLPGPAAPAAQGADQLRELEQVRPGPADQRDRVLRSLAGAPGDGIRLLHRQRQREDRRVVLRRPAAPGHLDDRVHGAEPVRLEAALHHRSVLLGQLPAGGVVGAAVAPEDEEALEPGPVIEPEGEPAGVVLHLGGARDGLVLRRLLSTDGGCVILDRHRGAPRIVGKKKGTRFPGPPLVEHRRTKNRCPGVCLP